MRIQRFQVARSGASTVEFAVVSGLIFFLIFALIVGASGIFRYQEVAHLAREGARYASTHGGQYILDGIPAQTGVSAISSNSDLANYLLPKAVLLSSSQLTISVSWSAPPTLSPINMPTYVDTNPNLVPPGQKTIQNYVTVTVTYQWMPELYLFGPITLTSTSVMAMSY
jgi:Flp pilus assembly protein TadG